MNIVFWLIVVVVLIIVWFCLNFTFKSIGGIGLRLFNDAKKEIMGNTPTKENEKGTKEDEG